MYRKLNLSSSKFEVPATNYMGIAREPLNSYINIKAI